MSFILDALKKSETDRQQQTGADFANVPSRSGQPRPPKWLWLLAALLGINIAVLVGILLRPDAPPEEPAAIGAPQVDESQAAEPTFEEQIAVAKQNQPARETEVMPNPGSQTVNQDATPAPSRPSTTARVLTIDEVRLNGTLQIRDLHLDIHVYSDVPAERFVFINMVKHREQSQLEEGPVVTEIRSDGVVLEYQGTTFLLPRE